QSRGIEMKVGGDIDSAEGASRRNGHENVHLAHADAEWAEGVVIDVRDEPVQQAESRREAIACNLGFRR
ncbi:MAG TPA: hypothetical protein VLM40_06120, partial [Gemmata sp.]|nr:hypothetical protein [Gemmata sp.]